MLDVQLQAACTQIGILARRACACEQHLAVTQNNLAKAAEQQHMWLLPAATLNMLLLRACEGGNVQKGLHQQSTQAALF